MYSFSNPTLFYDTSSLNNDTLKFQSPIFYKMKFSAAILCVITLTFNSIYSQKITISGYVKDAASKEALIGASVLNADSRAGTTTNQYGFFSLTIPVTDTIE